MAPTASTNSGSTGSSEYPATSKFITFCPDLLRSLQQRSSLHGCDCCVVVGNELLHRRCRHIEHWLWIDTKQDREHNQRRENDAFAQRHILDACQRWLVQRTEYDL